MPAWNAVTLSGNASPVSARNRSVQSLSTRTTESWSRAVSAGESCDVRLNGESRAACRISSEYAFPIPAKRCESVSARLSVWSPRESANANSVGRDQRCDALQQRHDGDREPGGDAAQCRREWRTGGGVYL